MFSTFLFRTTLCSGEVMTMQLVRQLSRLACHLSRHNDNTSIYGGIFYSNLIARMRSSFCNYCSRAAFGRSGYRAAAAENIQATFGVGLLIEFT
jgi:hypothetical protein